MTGIGMIAIISFISDIVCARPFLCALKCIQIYRELGMVVDTCPFNFKLCKLFLSHSIFMLPIIVHCYHEIMLFIHI